MKKPTEQEINDVLDRISDLEREDRTLFPIMTYEQGVKYGIEWLLGRSDNPLEE